MAGLEQILKKQHRFKWCSGLSVRAANALIFNAEAKSKKDVRKFVEAGGDLKKIAGIGVKHEDEILKWIESQITPATEEPQT